MACKEPSSISEWVENLLSRNVLRSRVGKKARKIASAVEDTESPSIAKHSRKTLASAVIYLAFGELEENGSPLTTEQAAKIAGTSRTTVQNAVIVIEEELPDSF